MRLDIIHGQVPVLYTNRTMGVPYIYIIINVQAGRRLYFQDGTNAYNILRRDARRGWSAGEGRWER